MSKLTPQEIRQFYRNVFDHFRYLPSQAIEEAAILLSCKRTPQTLYQSILEQPGKTVPPSELIRPSYHKPTKILHPTQWFLQPNKEDKFVTMYYLCRYVKRAKFIFVLSDQDTREVPMKNIKTTLSNFFGLIRKEITKREVEQVLAPSCALLIYTNNTRRDVYKSRLSEMCKQKKFLQEESSKILLEYLLAKEDQFLLLNPARNTNTQILKDLISKLKPFDLPKYEEIRLHSQSHVYVKSQFEQNWHKYMLYLWPKLQTLIRQTCHQTYKQFEYKQRMKISCVQNELLEKLDQFSYKIQGICLKDQQQPTSSLRLISFLSKYLQVVFMQINGRSNAIYFQSALKMFFQALQSSRFLRKTQVKQFMLSIYKIYQFFSSKFTGAAYLDLHDTLISKQHLDKNMYNFLQLLEDLLTQQLSNTANNNKYPFDLVIEQLSEFIGQLQRFKASRPNFSKEYSFFTSRIEQKLKTLKLELSYAKTLSQSKHHNISRSKLRSNWLHFLELQPHKHKISEDKVQQILQFIGLELVQEKYFELALQVFNLNWRRFSNRIIQIYERDYNLSLELIKYAFNRGQQNKKKPFEDYCKFLAKIDFAEKLNALCLEAFRWIKDKQYIQELKSKLRQQKSRNSSILDDQNGQQTKIQVDKGLIKSIRIQFQKLN